MTRRWMIGAGLLLLLWLGLTSAHATADAGPLQLVQATPAEPTRPPFVLAPAPPRSAPAKPAAGPAEMTSDRTTLMAALLRFVLDDYLGNGRPGHENAPELYAPTVTYYQRGRLDRARVMADKRAYYQRWPERTYTYVPDSLRIERAGEAGVSIVFRHQYIVAAGRDQRRGVAVTRLEVELSEGRFVIAGERGGVERRG